MDRNHTLPKRLGGVLPTSLHHLGKSKPTDSPLYPPPSDRHRRRAVHGVASGSEAILTLTDRKTDYIFLWDVRPNP